MAHLLRWCHESKWAHNTVTVGAWIPNIGILNVLKSDFRWFGFGMVSNSNCYGNGPDHLKTKPLEIQTKWATILFWFPTVLAKRPPFCSKRNNIGQPNTIGTLIGISAPTVYRFCPLFRLCSYLFCRSKRNPNFLKRWWFEERYRRCHVFSNDPINKNSGPRFTKLYYHSFLY